MTERYRPDAATSTTTPTPTDTATGTATITDVLLAGTRRLWNAVDNPRLEVRLLLAHAIGGTRLDLIRDPGRVVETALFHALIDRRLAHEPLAHILGRREFWSLDFQVSPATLIPRPDSETLVAAALTAYSGKPPPQTILDLGTGTGCLLLALLHEFPAAFGVGVDIAPDAARLARGNAIRLGLADRAAFVAVDWTNSLAVRFDLVVSNPPYIPTAGIATLMPDVARYEPRGALDGGADGYDAYRTILRDLPQRLRPGGVAVLELGIGQAGTVAALAQAAGFTTSLHLDLAGIQRAIVISPPAG
ncbi:peptide chain release factor N(5)-glutamine methyltransferase [Rhodopila globiformis]|uniref:Release factor glutamine methyltransferase n=1 Tax=Rhodopila globiformis TaxID=1071 RepID=A0A2S6NAA6_RHOGL|nr:peptide chain release factor N(5)-glutamine methyltransferase [Rhodopila globiformis]PPQ31545.1 protein-(glutamine-N5) methyltransferase, release factor-specific [Rhodopila globiformis]